MQNLGKKYEAFVTTMSDDAGDEKVRAALKAGLQDGDIEDDKIAIKEVSVPSSIGLDSTLTITGSDTALFS